ncbi:MAG: plsY [Phycisphaerales bacterium]|nr:plsY [Phycisphaerales bacterium]
MTIAQQLLILIPIAYVLGSIPFGLIVGLANGIDPRKAGSGNIGATNIGRLLGGRFFAIVFTLDFLKGLLPTLAASWLVHRSGDTLLWSIYLLWLAVGFAAILGHMFSLFLGFKGGKGVATSTGVLVGVFPDYTLAAIAVVVVWGIFFAASRTVSLASIVGAVAFPIVYVAVSLLRGQPVLGERWPLLAFCVLVALMVVWKHRGNIARLRAGTEPKTVGSRR